MRIKSFSESRYLDKERCHVPTLGVEHRSAPEFRVCGGRIWDYLILGSRSAVADVSSAFRQVESGSYFFIEFAIASVAFPRSF